MNRLLTGAAVGAFAVLLIAATTPVRLLTLQTDMDGGNHAVTNVSYFVGKLGLTNLLQDGATSGQVVKWNGTNWVPGIDNAGSGTNSTPGTNYPGTLNSVLVSDGTDVYWRSYAPNADWATGAGYLSAPTINVYGGLSGRDYSIPSVQTWSVSGSGIFSGDGSSLTNIADASFQYDQNATHRFLLHSYDGKVGQDPNAFHNDDGFYFGDVVRFNAQWLTNLSASALASGTVGTARLGTGTANSSTYLRGDGTWDTPTSSGVTLAELQHATNNLTATRLVDGSVPLARLASGTGAQFLRGDGVWTNKIDGQLDLGGDVVGWGNAAKVGELWTYRLRANGSDGITNTIILYTHTQSGTGTVTNTIQITSGLITSWSQAQ